MAKKQSNKKNKKKTSWFRLPKKGEISSVLAGLAVIALIGVAVWAVVSSYFLGPSETEVAEEAARVEDGRRTLEAFRARGVVILGDGLEEEVFVNAALWGKLPRIEQEKLAEAAVWAREVDRCFIKDVADSRTLAWFTKGSGYREAKAPAG